MEQAQVKSQGGTSCRSEVLIVDFDSLVRALTVQQRGEGISVAEIVEQTGQPEGKVRRVIGQGVRAGLVTVTRKHAQAMDGRRASVPSYIFKGQEG